MAYDLLGNPITPIGGSLTVHFIGLDRVKEVNDTLGHACGDFVLKTIAQRLRAVTRADEVVAHKRGRSVA